MNHSIRVFLIGTVLIPFALTNGCDKQQSGSGSIAGNQSNSSQSDDNPSDGGSLETRIEKHGDEVMASSTKAEARDWLKQPSHVIFKEDPKKVSQFVEDFYGAGADQVFIGDTEDHDGNQYAGCLLIVLPKDADKRAKLFEVDTKAGPLFQEDPVTDKGQKYLCYMFD